MDLESRAAIGENYAPEGRIDNGARGKGSLVSWFSFHVEHPDYNPLANVVNSGEEKRPAVGQGVGGRGEGIRRKVVVADRL